MASPVTIAAEPLRGVDRFWAERAALKRDWEAVWPPTRYLTGEQLARIVSAPQRTLTGTEERFTDGDR